MSRHYNPVYPFALGMNFYMTTTRYMTGYVTEPDPVDPPDNDPPEPAPQPTPDPAPAPEPVPLPPNDPPDPPDPDPAKYDNVIFGGPMILANLKSAQSHEGRWWWQITDDELDQWQPQNARHLLEILGKKCAHPHRNAVVFLLSKTRGWWSVVEQLAPRGLLILD